MTVPFDGWSVGVILGAVALLSAASRGSWSYRARLLCVLAAAFAIRLDPSWQLSLHDWDESVHAAVAKHLVAHPLVPTLYEQPALPFSPRVWTNTDVWLHKPPLALWLMAMSLAMFGFDAVALRLPSVVMSTASVGLTFLIGKRVFDARTGLLAAGFQTVNGLLVTLASGRRVADHVDTTLLFCVEMGVLAVVTGTDARRSHIHARLAGVALGFGLLAKSFPALVIVPIALVMWQRAFGWARSGRLLVQLLVCAAAVGGPWFVYVALAFPELARQETAYTLSHITTVMEAHGGAIWAYVNDMPRYFGELVWVPVVAFLWSAGRSSATPAERAITASLVVPYVVFSVMATKLTAFIAIAAPALFLAQAAVWIRWRDSLHTLSRPLARAGLSTLLVLLAALPARNLLEPTGPFERRERAAAASRQFMRLDSELGPGAAVLFNVPKQFEAMFYSRFAAYDRMPLESDVAHLHKQGVRIVVYQPDGQTVQVPGHWRAQVLPQSASR